jgi:hypothetical protein
MTGYDYPSYRRVLSQLGVRGYLRETMAGHEIADAIRAAAEGQTVFTIVRARQRGLVLPAEASASKAIVRQAAEVADGGNAPHERRDDAVTPRELVEPRRGHLVGPKHLDQFQARNSALELARVVDAPAQLRACGTHDRVQLAQADGEPTEGVERDLAAGEWWTRRSSICMPSHGARYIDRPSATMKPGWVDGTSVSHPGSSTDAPIMW